MKRNFAKISKFREKDLQKLEDLEEESSSSESEDDEAEAINPEFEKKFFHVLAQLKSKDPALYENDEKFFDKNSSSEESSCEEEESKRKKRKKEKPLYVRNYETKLALEGEKVLDEISDNASKHIMDAPDSYYGELAAIKKSFTEATAEHDKKFDEKDGVDALLSKISTSNMSQSSTNGMNLNELDDYWKKSDLDESEKYLRDYLLKKQYIVESDNEDKKAAPPAELLEEKEEADFAEKQEVFEYKYNTRFENPDHHFIKSYPRIIASSVRRKDEKRKKKRLQREKRKGEQRKKKVEEIARLKGLKRKSILEKIELLKEASGNTDIGFSEQDLNEDFDPEKYDKRMNELFNDDFYGNGEEEKPKFSDIEDDYDEEEYEDEDYDGNLPACEQPDFNMDCDYEEENVTKSKRQLKREAKKGKKKPAFHNLDAHATDAVHIDDVSENIENSFCQYNDNLPACEQPDFVMDCDYVPHKKSKRQLKKDRKLRKERKGLTEEEFLKTLNEEKSTIGEKSINEHLEEYYAMDYDDIIGDMPCRFRYRKVAPSNFGLATEDILLADNATLNTWCPLNRVIAHRLPEDEFYLRQKYARKSRSKRSKVFGKFYEDLKQDKILKKLKTENEDDEKLSNQDLEPSITAEENKDNLKDETTNVDSSPEPKKRTKLSARQRRRQREREEKRKRRELAHAGAWVKHQKNKSFQRLARIEPSTLKAYGLKPKQVLRKAKSHFDKMDKDESKRT